MFQDGKKCINASLPKPVETVVRGKHAFFYFMNLPIKIILKCYRENGRTIKKPSKIPGWS
jgi:hypothetical protein